MCLCVCVCVRERERKEIDFVDPAGYLSTRRYAGILREQLAPSIVQTNNQLIFRGGVY